MALVDSPTGRHLVESGLVTAASLERLERELSQADTDLEGRCPLDAERLRSRDAVQAYGIWLYVMVRTLRPSAIVETGVQNGSSPEPVLWAVHRNEKGRLFSIDSAPTSSDGSHHTPWNQTTDGVPGKHILRGLREYWHLTIGLTRGHLLDLCRTIGTVDFFWHDSDHSSENVRFEFATVKPFVPAGGILCLHDFEGQDVTLEEDAYELIVPQRAPYLRVWRKR